MNKSLRLGTRGSRLALWQSRHVQSMLESRGHQVELIIIKTEGDRDQSAPLANIGGQGVFTKGLQDALLDDRVDLAVHSLKDLPTIDVPGLQISAVPEREDPRDALIAREFIDFDSLPVGATIGTGSIRRRAQLLKLRPDLVMKEIRGNVETRVNKLTDGNFDAIVLAAAGLKRLDLLRHVTVYFASDQIFPAVGQGALGIETRDDDPAVIAAVDPISHPESFQRAMAERSMLKNLQGGCLAPIGVTSRVEGDTLSLTGVVLSADGSTRLKSSNAAARSDFLQLGESVARELLDSGADGLLLL